MKLRNASKFQWGNSELLSMGRPQILADYREALDAVFAMIRDCEQGRDISTLLQGPLCHTEFRRLN
jgi:hypothetical protein